MPISPYARPRSSGPPSGSSSVFVNSANCSRSCSTTASDAVLPSRSGSATDCSAAGSDSTGAAAGSPAGARRRPVIRPAAGRQHDAGARDDGARHGRDACVCAFVHGLSSYDSPMVIEREEAGLQ